LEGFKLLDENSVDLLVTSPPYAEQRKNQYGGVTEKEYPNWTVNWMREVKRIIKPKGSIFINIRPHLKKGVISDYVLKTRLALRQDGWKECEELIWIKPDSPPLGSIKRPRRAWESILWFSLEHDPFCNPKANGKLSDRIGFENSKFEHGGKSHIHAGQKQAKKGMSRCKDYIEVGTGKIGRGIKHPAMYPVEVPEYLIKMCCPEGGLVLDPFIGSDTTAVACLNTNRNYIGFEIDQEYTYIANNRIV
jgi:site-specific DNA-methyltransferase (adenine-specific)